MIRFLKIISFPIRLLAFLVTALISGIIFILNKTLVMILALASTILAFFGTLLCGLMVVYVLFWIGGFIVFPDRFGYMKESIPSLIISGILGFALSFVLMLTPVVAEKIFIWTLTAAEWLWGFSKMVITCDVDELRYY